MKAIKELKSEALNALEGNWGKAAVATIIYFIVIYVGDLVKLVDLSEWMALVSLVWLLVVSPVNVCYANSIRVFTKSGNNDFTGTMFRLLSDGYLHYLKGMLLMYLYIFLYSLLCVIPGIMMALNYAMVPYILVENPELSLNDALKLSRNMMYGHRWELVKLYLSFIGWIILSIFTLGIGYLWLNPYIFATLSGFYDEVKQKYESSLVVE